MPRLPDDTSVSPVIYTCWHWLRCIQSWRCGWDWLHLSCRRVASAPRALLQTLASDIVFSRQKTPARSKKIASPDNVCLHARRWSEPDSQPAHARLRQVCQVFPCKIFKFWMPHCKLIEKLYFEELSMFLYEWRGALKIISSYKVTTSGLRCSVNNLLNCTTCVRKYPVPDIESDFLKFPETLLKLLHSHILCTGGRVKSDIFLRYTALPTTGLGFHNTEGVISTQNSPSTFKIRPFWSNQIGLRSPDLDGG